MLLRRYRGLAKNRNLLSVAFALADLCLLSWAGRSIPAALGRKAPVGRPGAVIGQLISVSLGERAARGRRERSLVCDGMGRIRAAPVQDDRGLPAYRLAYDMRAESPVRAGAVA